MNIGRMRHRITIEAPTTSRDDFGDEVETWAEHCRPWARVETIDSTEGHSGDTRDSDAAFRITLRYRDTITKRMRVQYNGRSLEITGLDDSMRHRGELVLLARERDE